jgi:alcohol dehydrogenase
MKSSLPLYYEFYNPVKINAGKEALETIPYELKMLHAERSMIITDKGIVAAGLLDVLKGSFKDSDLVIAAVFDNTPPDSSVQTVNEIANIFRANNCNSLIALGGGSVIDTAKGVNILISEDDTDLSKYMGADRLKSPQKPLVVIPTTSGTGSELTSVAVISDTEKHVKMPFSSGLLLPKVAVLDPRMTLGLPPKITAAVGMDAMTHAVEAFSCLQKNPFSDAYAVAAIQLIRDNLLTVVKESKNIDARFAMANASAMAGAAFSNSMVGAVHAIGHACGAVAHVHHGNVMAVLLPWVMRFNSDEVGHLYADLLPFLEKDFNPELNTRQKAERAIDSIEKLNADLNQLAGMPHNLKSLGVKKEQFPEIAEKALNDGAMIPNPKELSKDDVLDILYKAM